DLVSQIALEKQLLWQQAQRAFRDTEDQVRKAVAAHDFETARRLSQEATSVIEHNRRNAATPGDYEGMRSEARGLADYVETEARAYAETQALIKQKEIIEAERSRIQKIYEDKARKVALLMNQAEELRKEQKYDEAIQVLKQVIAIDPTCEKAQ